MTPFIKGKSEQKIPYLFKFSIYKAKTTNAQAKDILTDYGFNKFKLEKEIQYDFQMRIRLEEHFNAVKLAGDLVKKHKDIFMEIRAERVHKE